MTWKERQLRSRRFWTQLPPQATALFFLSVFCLFASIGFIATGGSFADAATGAVFSGIIAVGFGFLGTRAYFRVVAGLALLLFVVLPWAQRRWFPAPPSAATPATGPASWAAVAAIIAGYLLMLFFIGTEGRRYYRLHTEIELAADIHKALAPPVAARAGGFEFAGASRPSGEVGGDLLDFVSAPAGWLAYIADVSGHGVAAGVLMGVVKSAARTWLSAHRDGQGGLLPGLNRTLVELLPAESFVTFAALAATANGELRFVAAGHPPLLHYHAATASITQLRLENLPLGLFAEAEFSAATVACAPGDVLALYTDGMVEIFNSHNGEFGIEQLSVALAQAAVLPLVEAVDRLLATVRAFGPQTDDQTLLLARRTSA